MKTINELVALATRHEVAGLNAAELSFIGASAYDVNRNHLEHAAQHLYIAERLQAIAAEERAKTYVIGASRRPHTTSTEEET